MVNLNHKVEREALDALNKWRETVTDQSNATRETLHRVADNGVNLGHRGLDSVNSLGNRFMDELNRTSEQTNQTGRLAIEAFGAAGHETNQTARYLGDELKATVDGVGGTVDSIANRAMNVAVGGMALSAVTTLAQTIANRSRAERELAAMDINTALGDAQLRDAGASESLRIQRAVVATALPNAMSFLAESRHRDLSASTVIIVTGDDAAILAPNQLLSILQPIQRNSAINRVSCKSSVAEALGTMDEEWEAQEGEGTVPAYRHIFIVSSEAITATGLHIHSALPELSRHFDEFGTIHGSYSGHEFRDVLHFESTVRTRAGPFKLVDADRTWLAATFPRCLFYLTGGEIHHLWVSASNCAAQSLAAGVGGVLLSGLASKAVMVAPSTLLFGPAGLGTSVLASVVVVVIQGVRLALDRSVLYLFTSDGAVYRPSKRTAEATERATGRKVCYS